MAVEKRPGSKYWQVRFEYKGVTVKRSAETTIKQAAKDFEATLRADLIQELEQAEREGPQHTWADAVAKFAQENGGIKSWERTAYELKVLTEHLTPAMWVRRITYTRLLDLRDELLQRPVKGHNWKTVKTWTPGTVNRCLRICGWVLNRCASEDWTEDRDETGTAVPWLLRVPKIPQIEMPTFEPPNVTRAQVCELLDQFPLHAADASVLALATGLRLANVTGLERSRIDLHRRVCWVPGYETKNGDPIPVPLNAEAIAVIERWEKIHAERDHEWAEDVRRYLIVFRHRAPIQRLTTRAWHRHCRAVGLEGFTFHGLRHVWASWQAQSGTSDRILMWLGGWKSVAMPQRYAHLNADILMPYAQNVLLRPGAAALVLPPSSDGPAALSAAVTENQLQAPVSPCFGADSRNRTVDPIITNTQAKKKVA
jgi:integrase